VGVKVFCSVKEFVKERSGWSCGERLGGSEVGVQGEGVVERCG